MIKISLATFSACLVLAALVALVTLCSRLVLAALVVFFALSVGFSVLAAFVTFVARALHFKGMYKNCILNNLIFRGTTVIYILV